MAFYGLSPVAFEPVTAVTATPGANDAQLGAIRQEGANTYIRVYNEGGANIAPGKGCVLQSGATNYSVTVSSVTSADLVVGVAVNTMTTGTYGWVCARGITSVQAATTVSIAVGSLFEIADNGVFVLVSNTTGNKAPPVGKALAGIASNATGSAFISVF